MWGKPAMVRETEAEAWKGMMMTDAFGRVSTSLPFACLATPMRIVLGRLCVGIGRELPVCMCVVVEGVKRVI